MTKIIWTMLFDFHLGFMPIISLAAATTMLAIARVFGSVKKSIIISPCNKKNTDNYDTDNN
uniref:Uncharacterized protein n=1 Tax=uncultured marine virus TaxID=186617 RepID=A0A0F7L3L6_9VIRU|nr:hypothetical protein [uncultured marine virus]